MLYLRRRDEGPAAAWWAEVEQHPHAAPGIVRELMRGPSVICCATKAEQALAWARACPALTDEPRARARARLQQLATRRAWP